MGWEFTHDVAVFHASAWRYLTERPVECTLPLTVTETLRTHGPHWYGEQPPRFGWWCDGTGSPVDGVVVQTPPFRPILSPMSATAVQELAADIRHRGWTVDGISGRRAEAEGFARLWCGAGWRVWRNDRLYRLGELTPPVEVPGCARVATEADGPLAEEWLAAFASSIGEPRGYRPGSGERRIAAGTLMLWDVEGTPVSMAGRSHVVAGHAKVGPVYTPRELRGRGYAGAVTAAVSRAAQSAGAAQVLLFADLANKTSTALYQRLGYRTVQDHAQLDFTE